MPDASQPPPTSASVANKVAAFAAGAFMVVFAYFAACLVIYSAHQGMDSVMDWRERPKVTAVVREWSGSLPLVRPLAPGTRPVLITDKGDPATLCRFTGTPGLNRDQWCTLSPSQTFGTRPAMVDADRTETGDWIVVASYTDGWNLTPRWLGLRLTRAGVGWRVEKFADIPLSAQPTPETVERVLANVPVVKAWAA